MKRISLLLAFILMSGSIIAQETSQKKDTRPDGYIGMGLGFTLPHGSFSKKMGTQANVVNFGYFFIENLGIAATAYDVVVPMKGGMGETAGHRGVMFGPLFSKRNLAKNLDLDLRPMIGCAAGRLNLEGETVKKSYNKLAIGAGTSLRFACSKNIGISVNYDYYATSADFSGTNESYVMRTSAFSFGLNFLLR